MPERTSFEVTRVGDEGDGVIDAAEGHPEHIPGGLPGDVVHRRQGSGWTLEIRPGPYRRAETLCPHFPACGGCTVQHMADEFYAGWKSARLFEALARHHLIELDDGDNLIEPLFRVPLRSRRRAVLTARHEDGRWQLGFHEHRSHRLVDIDTCAVMRPAILAALPPLRQLAAIIPAAGDCRMTVLETESGLDVAIEAGKQRPAASLLPELTRIAEAARVVRLSIGGEPILLRAKPLLQISGVTVEPPPAAFVQAAAEAEAAIATIAVEAIRKAKAKRVADLFSGLGAFTFALARHARVLAIDSSRPSIEALASAARGASGLKPIEARVRDLFQDPLSPRELDHIDAVLFDPPRAGARGQAESLAKSKVPTIVAVSCNPATLARDLRILVDGGYKLVRAVPIDQFLFTPHLEAVAVLRR